MRDRFLDFVNNDPRLKKKLDSFILSNSYYGIDLDDSDIFGSSFVKKLVSIDFKQDVFRLLDIFNLKVYRDSSKFDINDMTASFSLDVGCITRGRLFESVDIMNSFPKAEHFKEDGFYSLEVSYFLKRFPNVKFIYTFYFYEYKLDADSELRLTFIDDDGIPEDEFTFESDCSYQSLLVTINNAFDKLSEDKYRFGDA